MVENLGIEALVTARPYRLQIPLICGALFAPNTTTTLADAAPPLALRGVERLSLTVRYCCGAKAARGPRLHLCASSDGKLWTTARQQETIESAPRRAVDREIPVPVKWPFLKVLAQNPGLRRLPTSESRCDRQRERMTTSGSARTRRRGIA